MINRIVKLSFKPEFVPDFIEIFETSKDKIAASEGCHGVKLLRDVNHPNQFFTYSLWESEDFLNLYRHSELFQSTWAKTKIGFNDKPQAWSTSLYASN